MKTGKNRAVIKEKGDYHSLLKHNYIGALSVVIDRNITGEIKFDKEGHEDLVLWLDLVKKNHELRGIDKSLAYYRVRKGSLSGNKIKAAKWRWRVFYRIEKLGIVKSSWYFIFYAINSIMQKVRV